jgi:hypothetical protein
MIVSSGATHSPETTALAWDGDPNTRWTSGAPMEPTMAFWVVLDAPALISCVVANAGVDTDAPASWAIAVMDDEGGHGRKEVASGAGVISAVFEPVRGQVVRIECLSSDANFWWSIHELTVDTAEITDPVEPPIEPPADPPVVPPVVPPTEPPVVPPAEPEPGAVTDIGWRTWSEELCRLVVEGMAAKHGWVMKQREVLDFTTGQIAVKQAVIWTIGKVGPDGERDYWPFEIS